MLLRFRTMSAAFIAGALILGIGLTEARADVSALAQTGSASGLDISLEDGRLTMDVRDASLSQVLRMIAAKGGFALGIAGQLDSKVSASFENVPYERALRRIVGRSSYIIELAPAAGEGAPRRIGRLSVFARGPPAAGVGTTKRRKSSATERKRRKSSATERKRRKSSATKTK